MQFSQVLAMYARAPDARPLDQIDAEIADELDFHLEMRTQDNMRAGMSPEAARRDALARFGDLRRIHRSCRRVDVGDRIMLQRLQAIFTLVLVGAVAFLGLSVYRWQQGQEAAMARMRETLEQISRDTAAARTVSVDTAPPVVVATVPETGASDVDPSMSEIQVTFSKPMLDESWSWCTSEYAYPETPGEPRYLADGKTCVMSVKLKPDTSYGIWLNSEGFGNFKDREGRSARPYFLRFTTRKQPAL